MPGILCIADGKGMDLSEILRYIKLVYLQHHDYDDQMVSGL
jgi:hypothetical protein